ncbi:MAG: hypothetical protein PHS14_02390 [Elusimicrobia bacterium]|nr:hypothetical protein [Elusimicrobiota bacterium]
MRKFLLGLHKAVMTYAAWGWPLVAIDAALEMLAGSPQGAWRSALNSFSFAWILCAPVAPITWLLDRERRERAMAKLCGLREGDERERTVTGEAARATLLLSMSLQAVLLVMCLISVHLSWNPLVPKNEKHGVLSVGLGFSTSRHLDPFGLPSKGREEPETLPLGAPAPKPSALELGGYLLSPSIFPILALLILIQIAAFKAFALRRYEGSEA